MKYLIFVITFLIVNSCTAQTHNKLAEDFAKLPDTVGKPWCYWYWINDDISKEGITKDLIAIKEAGIGTVIIGNVNPAGVDGKVPLFSDKWWDAMVHAVVEGKRIGVDIGIFNCPGWSQSGGPWVGPGKAMRYLAYSETNLKGPAKVSLKLEKPTRYFQDTHVLAFPLISSEKNTIALMKPFLTSNPVITSLKNLFDGDTATCTSFDVGKTEYKIDISVNQEIEANSLLIYPATTPVKCDCQLFASIGGADSLISAFSFDRSNLSNKVGPIILGPLAISLPGVKSRKFTLAIKNVVSNVKKTGISEIVISEKAVVEKYIEKQLGKMHPSYTLEWNNYIWDEPRFACKPELIIEKARMLDISDKLEADGTLNWNVPEGNWTVMRVGMAPTGVQNHPSSPQGQGLEIDKMNSENVRYHFEQFAGKLLKKIPEESKPVLKYIVIDSYEVGSQNWTDGYDEKFKLRYGYDPSKCLPVISGRIVGSVTESERFLWDLRRSVADDIANEYVGGLKKIANEHNLKLWLENYGHWGYPSEFLKYGGQSDLVSGEFWNEGLLPKDTRIIGDIECKAASSAAHIYAKPVVSSEAFTANQKAYLRHPALLKLRGDWSYTQGINHLVLHVYIHQPQDLRKPGVNAWFGTEFNRHNTWFKYASSWTDYLRRCQLLLQEGCYKADVCYFIGEDAPVMTGALIPELPGGYSFDFINAEVILNRLTVKDGRFVLPDGMSYKIMILPPLKTMRPEVISKIEELVKLGGTIYGSKPERSPSLKNYPACDAEVVNIAGKLWGSENKLQIINRYGKGKVIAGKELREVFEELGLTKDVELNGYYPVLWTHRSAPEREIYFLTNQSNMKLTLTPSFRIVGMTPQLWDPITGEVRILNEYKVIDGRTQVPLTLNSQQSYFIVFAKSAFKSFENGYKNNFPEHNVLLKLDRPWKVNFVDKVIGPKEPVIFNSLNDWSEREEDDIKYYSGSAVYTTTFTMDQIEKDFDYYINLGDVQVMAKVKINDKNIGGTWTKPHILNTKGNLKKGENKIEIDIVNLWRNRMIKEKYLPVNERKSWWLIDDILPGEHLQPSGLLGPVFIESLYRDL